MNLRVSDKQLVFPQDIRQDWLWFLAITRDSRDGSQGSLHAHAMNELCILLCAFNLLRPFVVLNPSPCSIVVP